MAYLNLGIQRALGVGIAAGASASASTAIVADPSAIQADETEYVFGAQPIISVGSREPNFRMARLFSANSQIRLSLSADSTDSPSSMGGAGIPPAGSGSDGGDDGSDPKLEARIIKLLAQFEHSDWMVCWDVVEELGKIGPPAIPHLMKRLAEDFLWASRALKSIGSPSIPVLIEALKAADPKLRSGAAYTLGDFGTEVREALPAIYALEGDGNEKVRDAVRFALKKIKDYDHPDPKLKARVDKLIAGLENPKWQVRRDAAGELGRIGPWAKGALPALRAALSDDDDNVRKEAVQAYVHVIRLDRLTENDLHWEIERYMRWLLGGQEEHVMAMHLVFINEIYAARDYKNDPYNIDDPLGFRQAGHESLVKIGAPAIPRLITMLPNSVAITRARVAHVLRDIGSPSFPALIESLNGDNPKGRSGAAYAFGLFGPEAKDMVPALETMLSDEEENVREAIEWALEKIDGTV
jgi:HEAT repeat protein